MEPKKLAMVLGIAVLLPLFLVFFLDAVYTAPKWEDYCDREDYGMYAKPLINNCTDFYSDPEYMKCINHGGAPTFSNDANNCQVYDKCDYCQKDFDTVQQIYNRNIFFILAPLGLIIVLIGIYLTVEYIGAGLMFGGLITMFYATVRYFSDMSKLTRAIVLLVELLIIIYIGYKKIGKDRKTVSTKIVTKTKVSKAQKRKKKSIKVRRSKRKK